MDRAKVREIAGFTYSREKRKASSWYSCANSFYMATIVLGDNINTIDAGIKVFRLNAALSIELLLKAIIVATRNEVCKTHSLPELAKKAEVPFSAAQQSTLKLLSAILIWRGTYPVPTSEEMWNVFFDDILEEHIIRERNGKVYTALKRRETFPTNENIEKIWKLTHQRWDAVQVKAR